jgi:hypothetical protein
MRSVADAVGVVSPGCEIFGLSTGTFSLIDLIEHCLRASGPADVTVSTWTAGGADVGFAYGLLRNETIKSLRFLVDFSFPTRQPEYCAALIEAFGSDAVRITKTHAKFCLIRNADWNITIRSSMNLNENRRLESFEISDDPEMAAYLGELVDAIFRDFSADDQLQQGAGRNVAGFTEYFSTDPLGKDVRRGGWSYGKSGRRV